MVFEFEGQFGKIQAFLLPLTFLISKHKIIILELILLLFESNRQPLRSSAELPLMKIICGGTFEYFEYSRVTQELSSFVGELLRVFF